MLEGLGGHASVKMKLLVTPDDGRISRYKLHVFPDLFAVVGGPSVFVRTDDFAFEEQGLFVNTASFFTQRIDIPPTDALILNFEAGADVACGPGVPTCVEGAALAGISVAVHFETPEPGSWALLALGGVGLAAWRRR